MLGILLVSHGDMAKGLLSSAKMFFGDDIPHIDTLSLYLDTPVEEFKEKLNEKVSELNDGDGVLILADLFGGTPYNQSISLASGNIHVISGANLAVLVEVLGLRLGSDNINYDELVEAGKSGITHTDLNKSNSSEEVVKPDDFFD